MKQETDDEQLKMKCEGVLFSTRAENYLTCMKICNNINKNQFNICILVERLLRIA